MQSTHDFHCFATRLRKHLVDSVTSCLSRGNNFSQACSGQTEDSLRDCASDLSESLFQVVKLCGELCLALEVRPYVLRESKLTESSVQRADPDKPEVHTSNTIRAVADN